MYWLLNSVEGVVEIALCHERVALQMVSIHLYWEAALAVTRPIKDCLSQSEFSRERFHLLSSWANFRHPPQMPAPNAHFCLQSKKHTTLQACISLLTGLPRHLSDLRILPHTHIRLKIPTRCMKYTLLYITPQIIHISDLFPRKSHVLPDT